MKKAAHTRYFHLLGNKSWGTYTLEQSSICIYEHSSTKTFSTALILPKFQRGKAFCPFCRTGNLEGHTTLGLTFLLCYLVFVLGSGESLYSWHLQAREVQTKYASLLFLQERGWWGQHVALAPFKRRIWFCLYVHKAFGFQFTKRETFWSQVRS